MRYCAHHRRRLAAGHARAARPCRRHGHHPAREPLRHVSPVHQRICEFAQLADLHVREGRVGCEAGDHDDRGALAHVVWAE